MDRYWRERNSGEDEELLWPPLPSGDCPCCFGILVDPPAQPSLAALVAVDAVRHATFEALAAARAEGAPAVVFSAERASGSTDLVGHGDPLSVVGDDLSQMLWGLAHFWGVDVREVHRFSDVAISAWSVWQCCTAGIKAAQVRALVGEMSAEEAALALSTAALAEATPSEPGG